MAKVYCMQVEILLTASDITYQAVKHRSGRAVWQKLSGACPCLVYKFTQRRRFDV